MAKQFAVLGLGQFGGEVARRLASDGAEVLAVDRNASIVEGIKDSVTRAVIGNTTDDDVLKELGVEEVDYAIVALGGALEGSILTCLHLQELGVKSIIAKAISIQHEKILKKLGVKRVIYPEKESAQRLAKHLVFDSMLDFLPLAPGYSMAEVAPNDSLVGKSLGESQIRKRYGVQVVAIRELIPERWHMVPDPGMIIKPSDVLIVIGRNSDLKRIAAGEE